MSGAEARSERSGHCLCGAVRFRIRAGERFGACHCDHCRRWSGSPVMALTVAPEDMAIEGAENLAWYASSERGERGWCRTCGAHLFCRFREPGGAPRWEVMLGALDDIAGLRLVREIFAERTLGVYRFEGLEQRLTLADLMARMRGAGGAR